ncbi:MAG: CAP domain-containing protein [Nitrososphaerales archaeon]
MNHACVSIVGRFDDIPKYKPRERRKKIERQRSKKIYVAALAVIFVILAGGIATYYSQEVNYYVGEMRQGYSSLAKSLESSSSSTSINADWVQQFFGNISAIRESQGKMPYQHNALLDQVAQRRFNIMIQNYEISHYGYQQNPYGEEILYPAGYSPIAFVQLVNSTAPVHYELLISNQVSSYGFYLGQGPSYQVDQGCPVAEISGPGINESQLFEQHGCTYTIQNSTWFVMELN